MSDNLPKKVLIIGGPTGSGESTITNEIIKRHPEFQRIVAATSRPIRSREKEGINYYYFTKENFFNEIREGRIVEYTYVENRDVYYGTYKPELDTKLLKSHVIANVDGVGVEYFKKNYNAKAIFTKPSSLEMIAGRIRKRNPEMSDLEIQKRLSNAKEEIANEEHLYDYIVINDDGRLEGAISQIEGILKQEGYLK